MSLRFFIKVSDQAIGRIFRHFPSQSAGDLVIKCFNSLGLYQCERCGSWISRDWKINTSTLHDYLTDACVFSLGGYSCENGCNPVFFPPRLRKKIHEKEWSWEQRNGGDFCHGIKPGDIDYGVDEVSKA